MLALPRLRWLIIGAMAVFAFLYTSIWAYVEYDAHRAISMLSEAGRVQIGTSEASIIPFVRRYHGFKWTLERLPPKEQCAHLSEYEYQRNRVSEYKYELAVGPFGTTSLKRGQLLRAIRALRKPFPGRLRGVLGMRDWGTVVDLSIRNGRVQSVLAMSLVEGRNHWVGHRWGVAEQMPELDPQRRVYAIGAAILEMENGGGEMIENVFTTKASEEQVQAARTFNERCFTSFRGCDGLCDLAPRPLEYLKQHPDAVWNIIPPKCH